MRCRILKETIIPLAKLRQAHCQIFLYTNCRFRPSACGTNIEPIATPSTLYVLPSPKSFLSFLSITIPSSHTVSPPSKSVKISGNTPPRPNTCPLFHAQLFPVQGSITHEVVPCFPNLVGLEPSFGKHSSGVRLRVRTRAYNISSEESCMFIWYTSALFLQSWPPSSNLHSSTITTINPVSFRKTR
ncbi:hypothetical protein K435DRAFT_111750 [Dendrothele bispora CBS 962.96]|uniref:Uncharacterized protein n=1 Tax=Dendrothele bispora (strain CBS 962.96) TaxID=1314807 RepID=A0A4S8KP40_DENBC|nr:hypothetical protein K435DRAFT_124096 [Dendrothele bispora CBS 962.96]THU77058.1 hypothetical protein K435DRAFT_111750 [Dendrothele bispora CBS 962.96]